MDRHLTSYFLAPSGTLGLPNRTVVVEQGSVEEAEYLLGAAERGTLFRLFKWTVHLCDKKDVPNHPFFWLYTKSDSYYQMDSIGDYASGCRMDPDELNAGDRFCIAGFQQTRKLVLNPAKSKRLDIMSSLLRPNPLIISRRLKILLDDAGITGYTTYPCLLKGKEYTESEYALEFQSAELEAEATHFQLVVTSKVRNNPFVGEITIDRQCPRCGRVFEYHSDLNSNTVGFFRAGDLSDSDFQAYDGVNTSNMGELNLFAGFAPNIILSSKLFGLLLDNKVTGLTRYSPSYNQPYRFVEVC